MGRVVEVGETGISKNSGIYLTTKIVIAPYGASNIPTYQYFCHRPEWLVEMTQKDLQELEEQVVVLDNGEKKYPFGTYQRNIHSRDKFSTLRGLAGSEEAFNEISSQLIEAGPTAPAETINKILADFLLSDDALPFGYILKQKWEKTGEKDENGKDIYIAVPGYNLDSWFDPTPENLKKLEKKAEKSQGKIKMTYDGTPF